jgi:predicted unusual protein kinase regulating ubiquinone biosynthesis (AarF/ABC1/UbiB family)
MKPDSIPPLDDDPAFPLAAPEVPAAPLAEPELSGALETPAASNGSGTERHGVVAPIGRRKRINLGAAKSSTLSLPPKRTYQTNWARVTWRLAAWLWRLTFFLTRNSLEKLMGRANVAVQAVRLRRMLEGMGPTAIKIGQQLSIRADLLPHQFCDELSRMLDDVPPYPFEFALKEVEESIGGPLEKIFAHFDPLPIGSGSLACVYQARLKTGEKVAVKVKRPGIGEKMATDMKAISWICRVVEGLGFVRTGLTRNLQIELNRMLSEELDFTLEARYTEIFRQETKKQEFISAPRVYDSISNFNVLVQEFVAGVFLSEMLYAIERKDRESLDSLLARGFKPKLIARRMLHIFWWECFESFFFHADPHPSNIIVRPDNTIVMIDFGSCGAVSTRMRRQMLSFNRSMVRDDLNGMVQMTISMLEPLPHFDVSRFSDQLMNVYREGLIAHKCGTAPWYDKCSGSMWMKVIILSQHYNLPMTLDTVRIFRANFLYDSIVYRLHPGLDAQKEFRRWAADMDEKNRDRALRDLRKRMLGPIDSDFTRQKEMTLLMEAGMARFQSALDQPSYNFALSIGKVAFAVTLLLQSSMTAVAVIVLITWIRLIYAISFREPSRNAIFEAASWTFHQQVVIWILAAFVLITVRKLLMKLKDVEVKLQN